MTRGMGGHSPSNITHHLQGVDFPANREQLVKHAKKNNAEQDIIQALQNLPEDNFDSMADVMRAFGEEERGG